MKKSKIIVWVLIALWALSGFSPKARAAEEPHSLYAASAVLMDGDSGRILYEKNGEDFLANASTTKILTCILALEKGNLSDYVSVSAYAATMPDVQLNIREGEQYTLENLLYSLMLESHNDVAVAIAEHLAGSCEEFSELMNQKAGQVGCENTYFLTPNGLDAVKGSESHGTTARDLALLMRYCISLSDKKEDFLRITRAPSHSFTDKEGKRSFTCHNRNSFLNMMEGALSGKTGFTSKAGYCYVGALQREGKTYVVALLACGWPGNKHYKWEDTRNLMEYGLENYRLYSLEEVKLDLKDILNAEVAMAKNDDFSFRAEQPLLKEESGKKQVLLKEGEKIEIKVHKNQLTAPVEKGEKVGEITYLIDKKPWIREALYMKNKVEKIDYRWCFEKIIEKLLI